jgi:probable DNA repair protein
LPRETTQTLVDLDALLPLIDAGFILLTPNERLARRIKTAWDQHQVAQGKTAWQPVQVFPLERWLLLRWERAVQCGFIEDRVVLSADLTLELWRQVIEAESEAGGHFSLLQTGPAAAMAHRARDNLLRWQACPRTDAERELFRLEDDCRAFLAWMDRFEQRVADLGMATPADCIARLLAGADALPRARVALVGLDDVPPLFLDCLRAQCEQIETCASDGSQGTCMLTGYSDQRSELVAVATWARIVSREEPGATMGIVLQDMATERPTLEYLLRREFDCLGGRYHSLPVNFSTGITLDRAPVVRDALRILGLGLGRCRPDTMVALLQSRFIVMPDAGADALVGFIKAVYASGRETLSVQELQFLAGRSRGPGNAELAIAGYLTAESGLRRARRKAFPSAWVADFCARLDVWGWPGPGALDTLEYQQVELWYQALEQFAACDEIVGTVTFESAFSLLQRCLAGQVSQPRSDDSRIHVLGPLEAVGLAFDYLWLCSMQGSRWPAAPRPSPFIPMALQRKHQFPHATAQREWEFCENLMSRYQHGTGTLLASYARQIDGISERPSALVSGWRQQQCDGQTVVAPGWLETFSGARVEYLADHGGPAAVGAELTAMSGGSRILEDQSLCPFRGFARHRLQAEPLAKAAVGPTAAERGSLLHQALFELFDRVGDSKTLHRLGPAGREEQIVTAVARAIATLPAVGPRAAGAAWCELETERLAGLLQEWLTLELQRSEFRVVGLEQEIEVTLEALPLSLRIDRIDSLPDGSRVIIDYKSGVSRLRDWLGERPARPQLLLYSLAAPTLPSAVCFAQVRRHDCVFVGAGSTGVAPGIRTDIAGLMGNDPEVPDWASLNARWQDALRCLAREFVSGAAQVEPRSGACKTCELQPFCRIGLAGAGAR